MLSSLAVGILVSVGLLAQSPDEVDLIVYNATVVTMDSSGRVLPRGAVAIQGREIVAVEPAEAIASRYTAKETLDAGGQIVMPGLVNTHGHAPMVLYRGLADDLALMEWLQKYIFPAEAKTVSPEMVRIGTKLAALEMIQSGTTTFADMYYFEDEIARATKAAGLRGVLGQTVIQFPVADAKTPAEALIRAEAFLKEFAGDELITPAIAPHAMYTLDAATLKSVRGLADKYKAPVLIHLSETADEQKTAMEKHKTTPTRYLESLGFWGPRTVAAHAVWLNATDIEILARRHVGVSHNPESNMKLASGVAKVPDLLKAGVAVGLGTDGAASNNDLDMFEAMRQAAFLHKLVTGDPRVVSAQQLRSEIRKQAERESQLILREARAEGERLIDAARAEIERLQREVEQLERARRAYLAHLRTIVERQLAEIEAASAEPPAHDDGNNQGESQRHSRQTPAWLNSLIKE